MASKLCLGCQIMYKGIIGRSLLRPLFPIVQTFSTDARPKSGDVLITHARPKSGDGKNDNAVQNGKKKKGEEGDAKSTERVLSVGDTVSVNKLISVGDVDDFCELTGDYNTVHTQDRIVHGAFLNALVSSVLGTTLPGPGTMVVSQNLHFPAPCIAPQGIIIDVNITSARKIIGCDFTCRTFDGLLVLKGDAKLIKKKKM